ncbi:MAG TPA: GAF domain-containing protein [Gemmatimonadaceae bacterium]|nr:GAF domain-containing protein [Gemmatimonadaceae bacterium]
MMPTSTIGQSSPATDAGRTGQRPEDGELARRYAEVSTRMLEADRESGELVKLYITLRQLYEAPDRAGVLASLAEIIVSVIGSESFAVLEVDATGTTLRLVESMGADADDYRGVDLATHPVGRLAAAGGLHVAPGGDGAAASPDERSVIAVVPLHFGDALAGALLIFRLLPHRDALEEADLEVLRLLSTHAIPAVRLAALRADARLRPGRSA